MVKNFEYDTEVDSFYIYSNKNDEKVMGSIPMGNFIYDISSNGKVVGLEIDNASKVFKISPKVLEKAGEASLSVTLQGNMLMLGFAIALAKERLVYSNVIPREKISIVA